MGLDLLLIFDANVRNANWICLNILAVAVTDVVAFAVTVVAAAVVKITRQSFY